MPMTSRRDPAVLVAGLVSSILWIGTAVLSDWVHANFTYKVHSALVKTVLPHPTGTVPDGTAITGQTILSAFLVGLVVIVVTYLATRRLPRRAGTWAVFLGAWFALVVGGTAGSVADTAADIAVPPVMSPAFELLAASFDGGWWGMAYGWLVGLALVGALALSNRSAASALPSTRRARKPVRARAYPAVLVAGLVAPMLWVAVGVGGSWLVWHRSARGPIDLFGEVAPGAMILHLAPGARALEVSEVVLAVVVALVVAAGTWLATRRLDPSAGLWTLVLAVWFVVVAGAMLAAAARSFSLYASSGLHSATLNMVLPSLQASLFWSLALGWVVGLLAALTYRRTGGRKVTDPASGDSSDDPEGPAENVEKHPDDAPERTLHTDVRDPSPVP